MRNTNSNRYALHKMYNIENRLEYRYNSTSSRTSLEINELFITVLSMKQKTTIHEIIIYPRLYIIYHAVNI